MRFEDLLERLREFDLVLDTDPKFPSIAGFVMGESPRGTWWAHPQGKEVYRLACLLRSHPDVLLVKLVSGKITLVNRPLWPAVFAIGTAREAWQTKDLSKEAKALLKEVEKDAAVEASGDPARELEARLLVYSESVHTERGMHKKHLSSWTDWAGRVKLPRVDVTVEEGKAQIERVVARLNKQFGANGTLPWTKRARRA